MQGEIGNKQIVTLAVFQKGSRFAGAHLVQQHFNEEVGIDKQSHSPLLLQRAMRCCKSTEV
jgi:hypothetical protein